MTEVKEQLDPQVYFDIIKSRKYTCNDKFLDDFQDVIDKELGKAMKTGQDYVVRRLAYVKSCIEKERQLVRQGIDVYVLREDIEEYIKMVDNKVVKILELEMYPRSIPDEVALKVAEYKEQNLFDRFYIVFTDYTGEVEKQVSQEKRRKDPIIFGTWEQKLYGIWDISDRFYFIADWEDEYCDLTLSKMVAQMSKKNKDIVKNVSIEKPTQEQVLSYVNALREKENNRFISVPQKPSFFKKVKTAWKALVS